MRIQELVNISPQSYFYNVRDQLKDFIYKRSEEAFEAGDRARDAISSISELEIRRDLMRENFIQAIGGLPSSDTPLNAKTVDTIECQGFKIEKVIFESRPEVFVTANLYIPEGITLPRGAVLFLCGHHTQAKHEEEYQLVCRCLVKSGLVVLAQDPIGQGERFSYYEKSISASTVEPGTIEHTYAGCQSWQLGDSIARYFLHDSMRGIDYLCSRPEVDPKKIGVTGNSGGGTQTSMMMLCDKRISAAAPATFIINRHSYLIAGGAQDAEQIWPGMTALGFDHEDILLSMVPRPVLVLAVKHDFFPIEGTRRSVDRATRFWKMFGEEQNIELFEWDSSHAYTYEMAQKAAEFFSLHLLGKKISDIRDTASAIQPLLLWCTESGQVRGELGGARAVYDENLTKIRELGSFNSTLPDLERREKAFRWLSEKVCKQRSVSELNPRRYISAQVEDFMVDAYVWWSQKGLMSHAFIFRDYTHIAEDIPLTLAIWDGGTKEIQRNIDWIRMTCKAGRAVMVLDVSGTGGLLPNSLCDTCPTYDFFGVIYKLATDLIFLNDSLPALRTYDILRAVDVMEQLKGIKSNDVQIYSIGRYGLYAQLAAFLDKRITGLNVENNIKSFTEWVKSRYYDSNDIMSIVFPEMLKYFDIPELDRWVSSHHIS